MSYCPKHLVSTVQDIIYPKPLIPMTFMHHKLNLKRIKDKQIENKLIQESKKNEIIRKIKK